MKKFKKKEIELMKLEKKTKISIENDLKCRIKIQSNQYNKISIQQKKIIVDRVHINKDSNSRQTSHVISDRYVNLVFSYPIILKPKWHYDY